MVSYRWHSAADMTVSSLGSRGPLQGHRRWAAYLMVRGCPPVSEHVARNQVYFLVIPAIHKQPLSTVLLSGVKEMCWGKGLEMNIWRVRKVIFDKTVCPVRFQILVAPAPSRLWTELCVITCGEQLHLGARSSQGGGKKDRQVTL